MDMYSDFSAFKYKRLRQYMILCLIGFTLFGKLVPNRLKLFF